MRPNPSLNRTLHSVPLFVQAKTLAQIPSHCSGPVSSNVRPHHESPCMTQLLQKRFAELESQATQIEATRTLSRGINSGTDEYVNQELFLAWCVKSKSLLTVACGADSEHYRAFVEAENYGSWSGNVPNFQRTRAVFGAAKEDFEGGYLTSIRHLVQAEVFDTELEQAKELLSAGYYPAAAVISGVVLETTLRQLCVAKQLAPGKLDRMNADLAKAGQYNSLIQKRITALAAIRNSAAHGDHKAFSRDEVAAMIDEVERLVGIWLS